MAAPANPKIRAAALAELLAGEPVATTARKHNIARSTLLKWWEEEGLSRPVATQLQRDELGDAIDAWLVKGVKALTVQLDLAMDLDWLRGHSPADFATLFGVLADKIARVAQTQQVGQPADSTPTPIRRAS